MHWSPMCGRSGHSWAIVASDTMTMGTRNEMTELWTGETIQGVEASKSASRPRRQRSWEVDVQRARALRGDALQDLTNSQREWVWRSLLRGVRLSQAAKLAQLPPEETPHALQQVANRYSALMDQRRREREQRRSAPVHSLHRKEQVIPQ
jgi:hypothetical protein